MSDSPFAARSAGVLLHPTSLPGPYGVGDLGPAAREWVDRLADAGVGWWQVLPLGPTGFGDSPYQCFSAFALNPNLLSPDDLLADGLIQPVHAAALELPHDGPVDFERVSESKRALVAAAHEGFRAGRAPELVPAFERFCAEEAFWLDDFALFMALKKAHGGGSWHGWPEPLRRRDPDALAAAEVDLDDAVDRVKCEQFLAARQWETLRQYARDAGVRFVGDMPIFIADDSADVWARPDLFELGPDRRPLAVAGVPPDYFSETGQLWGNPLYAWGAHAETGYAWWRARLRTALGQVDLIRLDHFRGFEAFWRVPAGEPTARNGEWVPGPGRNLLLALRSAVGELPIIAEDLGVITPDVDALRTEFGLPGMRILQFAFGGAVEDRFLPHNFENPTVVYTGTHDNDTTEGWFASLEPDERRTLERYLGPAEGASAALLRAAWASVAKMAVAPAQDLLGLGTSARMNYPGRPGGNWRWRLPPGGVPPKAWARLAEWTEIYGRKVGQSLRD